MLRFSCSGILLIAFIVTFSIFVANVVNLLSVDENISQNISKPKNTKNWFDQHRRGQLLKLDDSPNHLMWFLQISDIHISIFDDGKRVADFQEFVSTTVNTIKPSVVLASGDLTDAKDRDHLGSRQYIAEWKIYREILDENDIENKTVWLDIRGNHDNFNVPGDNSPFNLFRKYSAQGGQHKRSYLKQIRKGNEKYSFIAVDACLNPGLKRPFNFIGYLTLNDTNNLISLAEEARETGGNYTIWFGHYPTSCIVSTETGSYGLRKIIGEYEEGIAYLCGHLHTLGGIVPKMYTLQRDGFLELELGDWKVNRTYRLAAIDHGLFSFADLNHNGWPVILITNPKHALFNIPGKEDAKLQIDSSHIRLLAFSPAGIKNCTLRINGKNWQICKRIDSNLFVVPWNSKDYLHGLWDIEAVVYDNDGRQSYVKQPFSMDGTRLSFGLFARFILMTDASLIFRTLFFISLALCIVPLLFFRGWHYLVLSGKLTRPNLGKYFPGPCLKRFWILSTVDRIIVPTICYCLYLIVGPWSIGEVLDGHVGIVFSSGVYIQGGYLPHSLTYFYGFFQLMLGQLPLIFIFAKRLEERYLRSIGTPRKQQNRTKWIYRNGPFFIIIGIEIILAVLFWSAYGTMAFLLGPFRTWSVVMNLVLWYMAKNIPNHCLASAAKVWKGS